jgi:hypothetical protein
MRKIKAMDISTIGTEAKTAYMAGTSLLCGITGWIQIKLPWLDIANIDIYLTYATRIVSVLVGLAAIVNYFVQWFKKNK